LGQVREFVLLWAVLAFRQHRPFSIYDFSGCIAAQILGLGGIDSTNSALNIGPGPRIGAVVGGAGETGVHFPLAQTDLRIFSSCSNRKTV